MFLRVHYRVLSVRLRNVFSQLLQAMLCYLVLLASLFALLLMEEAVEEDTCLCLWRNPPPLTCTGRGSG